MSNERKSHALQVVMNCLPHADVCRLAMVCKTLSLYANVLVCKDQRDLSRGLERFPITFKNEFDSCKLPTNFWYMVSSLTHAVTVENGCDCHGPLCSQLRSSSRLQDSTIMQACPCSTAATFGLLSSLESASPPMREVPHQESSSAGSPEHDAVVTMQECGPSCKCGPFCPLRATQHGIAACVTVFRSQHKGWCVKAGQKITSGSFVSEYVGEYLSNKMAENRLQHYDQMMIRAKDFSQAYTLKDTRREIRLSEDLPASSKPRSYQGHALLVVREMLPSGVILRTNIDATSRGNVAKFFNHSCDGGNLRQVLIQRSGSLLPAVALFARRDIEIGEELTFAYGLPNPGIDLIANPGPELAVVNQEHKQVTNSHLCSGQERPDPVDFNRNAWRNPFSLPSNKKFAAGKSTMQKKDGSFAGRLVLQPCLCGTLSCLGWMPNNASS
ncbi:hypothetical protein CEUSTIGMA_g11969.t1 [Chlamydomonas eustigma]|uniref:SET domain-containing protein n=1 Tax=Chlamydomonas eustigma TaxID=1157962 RepID=A0A250XNA6_9CHLO|nr:hypothetical protein CEUSTIGMA_g11969.t1 [Chlamydomonas eustigma]|eukprot:GAX84548.1 hypothetical protein CEUSTIGMA_g11969.t1 [Chlamydomonas eustigma]